MNKKKVTITGWRIDTDTKHLLVRDTVTVHIRGWDHHTKVDVQQAFGDSMVRLVCRAAAHSAFDWRWPWWRFAANRMLEQEKDKCRKQLWLESLDEGMEGM